MPQLNYTPLTAEEDAQLQTAARRLERLLDASNKFVGPSVEAPLRDSPVYRAYHADLRDPYTEAFLLLFAAEDHLRPMLPMMKAGPLPGFSLYTLLRAAGEAAVRCRHLLERKLTETQRLARALNERVDNIKEVRKVDKDPKWVKYYDGRIVYLENRAVANGIKPIRKTAAAPITAFGEPQETLTDLFGLYLTAGSTAFRFLSGFTHSMMWALIRPERAQPTSDPKVSQVPTDLDIPLFTSVLGKVLDLHDENCGCWLGLAGYPPEVWENAKIGPNA